jgi:endonuclease YncB( thermonuclease family)
MRAALSIFLLLLAVPAMAGEVTVIDGQTLEVDGRTYRLTGIAAPAMGETCRVLGHERDCGLIARAQLLDLTAGAKVECRAEAAGPATARCLSNGYDLSAGMVHTGWARATAAAYVEIEAKARAARRGMWRPDAPD